MTNAQTQTDFSKYLMDKRNCPVCGGNDFDPWTKWEIFDVVECKKCSLAFVNPCLNEEGLVIVYGGHHESRLEDEEACRKREIMYEIDRDFLTSEIESGKILDIGCGGGFFLDKFDFSKWEKFGVEIDPDTPKYAKEKFGVEVKLWDSKKIPFDDQSMDVIVFRGSFEHLLYPDIVAKEVERVLKLGGYLYICAIPNGASFCAQLYKEKWNQFDAKEHIFLFSPKTLKNLFEPLGIMYKKHTFPYEQTPYCNLPSDLIQVSKDLKLSQDGKRDQMSVSPAFWGNMLDILFQKG